MSAAQQKELTIVSAERILGAALLTPPLSLNPQTLLTLKPWWSSLWPADMTEFWLISAPGEKTCQQTWDKLMVATTRANNLSNNNKFNIPDLKVGTLDVLVGLSDELAKLDTFVER